MRADYQLTASPHIVLRTVDNVHIQESPLIPDWVAYQEWLAAGGVPDPYVIPLSKVAYDWGPRLVEAIGEY